MHEDDLKLILGDVLNGRINCEIFHVTLMQCHHITWSLMMSSIVSHCQNNTEYHSILLSVMFPVC